MSLKSGVFLLVYWFVNLTLTDKHGTKIYRDLSTLGEGKRKKAKTNNKEQQNIPTIQEEMDVTSVQHTSTEEDSQKPDHTCSTCTKGVRT